MSDTKTTFSLPQLVVLPLVEAALREDIRSGDITTNSLIPVGSTARARMVARESGVLCGVDVARLAFTALDPSVHCTSVKEDGAAIDAGETILQIDGEARAILT